MAHIIGASKDGPRGGEQSKELAKDSSNILLACGICHKEIDDSITRGDYSVERLREMKAEHTTRVRMLLEQPGRKTRPLIFTTQIGLQQPAFSKRAILQAILPDYPDKIEENWYKISLGSFDRENTDSWKLGVTEIGSIINDLNRACKNGGINHVSVFGLAPQPLLMYLGRSIGDKISCQIFEPRRSEDQDEKWKWDKEDGKNTDYIVKRIKVGKSNDAILLIALSDYLNEDKYAGLPINDPSIYELSINNPVQGFLTKKSDVSIFIKTMRSLLNSIQKDVGKISRIHVVPAMPASLAIEFGRLIQPTKDPEILVYEYISGNLTPVVHLT
tara:strand:+ start:66 stop:1055 length:990 start_codon:yes stop_codon:yes gene_type:complete